VEKVHGPSHGQGSNPYLPTTVPVFFLSEVVVLRFRMSRDLWTTLAERERERKE
jgi:hypothetical protein